MNFKSIPGLKSSLAGLVGLLFPHRCAGCGWDGIAATELLCAECRDALPYTHFEHHNNNPVAKAFWGRLLLTHATSQYFFTKDGTMQQLIFELKYRGNKDIGIYMGSMMGRQLAATNHFREVDALVPLPLYPEKEHKRGYNQAKVLCDGIAEVMDKPALPHAVVRTHHTESQTRKSRVERWQNMEGRFMVKDKRALEGKHLLLIDDVVTTGATLEACGRELLDVPGVKLSVATLCCAFS